MLELCEDLLDGVEVGAVRRQEQQPRADGADRGPDALALVAAEVVEDDDVSPLQGRDEDLIDVGGEADAVDQADAIARRGPARELAPGRIENAAAG